MTRSSLKEELARLGPIRAVDRVLSGSPVDLVLRPLADETPVRAVDAVPLLSRRGLSMMAAKSAIETALDNGEVAVRVPLVENVSSLARELLASGLRASRMVDGPIDVRALRQRLGMTEEQFALRYGFEIDVLKDWESGISIPDRATARYLHVIARSPRDTAHAQEIELIP
jgi:putative transcriptional regulator